MVNYLLARGATKAVCDAAKEEVESQKRKEKKLQD
jgi:hypothetical protein